MAIMVTRGEIGDYQTWKQVFDADPPKAREHASRYRVLRGVDEPGTVIIEVEFPTVEAAREGRRRLVDSGVLQRFEHVGPTIVEEADAVVL